jgi:hypothetical protein
LEVGTCQQRTPCEIRAQKPAEKQGKEVPVDVFGEIGLSFAMSLKASLELGLG